jgi:peroxiredoxin
MPLIPLGDPVPWFGARTVTGTGVDLHVQAGRWVVLAFLGRPDDPRTAEEMARLLENAGLFDEDRVVVYGVLPAPPADLAIYQRISSRSLAFMEDYDGAIARLYGAEGSPRTIVLDAMLRAVANIAWDDPAGHADQLSGLLRSLPPIDESVGVPLVAPVLIVPRVFDFDLCDFLVQLYDSEGGTDSGFLRAEHGKTATIVDHHYKRRQDLVIGDPQLKGLMQDRVVRRLVPAIERYFQFRPTRMDRTLVSCYDSADGGGHFYRHRDNILPGSRHRRFAMSLGLNGGYEGGEVVFPEFGRRGYRPPVGGAVVFSTAMLHEVRPVTAGRRFVFVPFLYGEEDVQRRLADNALLGDGGVIYRDTGDDKLFPDAAAAE